MLHLKRRSRQRRLEVRRSIPVQRGNLWRRFVQAGGPGAVAIGAVFALLASLLVVFPLQSNRYREGQQLPNTKRYARVAFAVPSEAKTKTAREAQANATPPALRVNAKLWDDLRRQFAALPAQLEAAADVSQVDAEPRGRFNIQETNLAALRGFTASPEYTPAVDRLLEELMRPPILVGQADTNWMAPRAFTTVKLQTPAGPASADRADIYSLGDSRQLRRKLDRVLSDAAAAFPSLRPVQDNLRAFLLNQLAPPTAEDGPPVPAAEGQPTYVVDYLRTNEDIELARAREPVQMEEYPADTVIFSGGEVRKVDVPILQAEQKAYEDWLRNPANPEYDPFREWRIGLSRTGVVLLVVLGMGIYIARYQPRVIRNHWRSAALAALLLLLMGLAKLIVVGVEWPVTLAAGIAAMGAIIVTIAYDQRFAFAIGAMLAILLAMEVQMVSVSPFLVLMAGVTVNVFLLKEIRTRSKLVEVGAAAAAATFVTAAAVQLQLGLPWSRGVLAYAAWGAGSVLAVGFIIQGLLPAIERTFRIATSMTLLELCDANNKLLKRLAIEAPGTYNHSLLLGTLCEAAAEAIRANGLLARVGAYYHDIGKINKPEYFIENKQSGAPNKHDKLSPAMSLLIIVGHVKDGLEMAREYNLPPVLREFIATHHGTTLVQYFFHAATEQRKAAGAERLPEEVEFRYGGPKPRSKEAAILMLADAVESSVRAMSDPTPSRIETQVHHMIQARLMDGQLDDCDLTLREVHEIERSLVKGLQAMYHGRIAYPKTSTARAGEGEAEPRAAGA